MELLIANVKAAPLWQQVVDRVRRSIQTGQLRPGDRVVEAQLAAEFRISRNPIREALRQLQQQGVLEYRPNVGTVVTHLAKPDVRFAVEMRTYLEVQAIHGIIEAGELNRLNILEKVLSKMEQFGDDGTHEEAELLDEEFHSKLVAISGSKMLQCIWQSLDPYTWMAIAFLESEAGRTPTPEGLYARHRRLLDIFETGDILDSERAITKHIMEVCNLLVYE